MLLRILNTHNLYQMFFTGYKTSNITPLHAKFSSKKSAILLQVKHNLVTHTIAHSKQETINNDWLLFIIIQFERNLNKCFYMSARNSMVYRYLLFTSNVICHSFRLTLHQAGPLSVTLGKISRWLYNWPLTILLSLKLRINE